MSDPVPPKLASSQSFNGKDSPSVITNIQTRRAPSTSTLEFFAPASKSFQPLPYTPHALFTTSDNRSKNFTTRHTQRSQETLAHPGMDPLPTDPNVVFIHPPFLTFPDSHLHPDGLSYQLLANNPEWFLDPSDFVRKTNTTPGAIAYPPVLEPPRGWCPARKKDLKDRGSEGWPEGEEPRLRCTFCRRTYAGVNAKSMWRRHVFEKHKIAMANRRDGNDRPNRGRSAGKENKQASSSKSREEPHDKLLCLDVAPQPNTDIEAHKSKFRTAPPPDSTKRLRSHEHRDDVFAVPKTPEAARSKASGPKRVLLKVEEPSEDPDLGDPHVSPLLGPSEDPLLHPPDDALQQLSENLEPALPEESPLDGPFLTADASPTLTLHHSPPPVPSNQPWRYTSPSHPLHSQRNIPLTMLAPSPLAKAIVSTGRSPQSSPFSTPNVSRSSDLKTPSTLGFSLKSASRPWFFKYHLGSPLDKHTKGMGRLASSPLSSSLRGTPARSHKRGSSAISEDWLGDHSTLSIDFSDYSPWRSLSRDSSPRKAVRSLGDVSPVLRTGPISTDLGLGAGLLAPFCLPKETTPEDIGAELDEMDKYGIGRPAGLSTPLKEPLHSHPSSVGSPRPTKRRRVSNP